jgi:hypothetical protein
MPRNHRVRDSQVTPSRRAETAKDRRRPGRIDSVSAALLPLLRNPTEGFVAGYAPGHYDLYDATGSKSGLQTTCMLGDQLPYAPCGWFWSLADERPEAEKSQAMKVVSVDAASLAAQAGRCRRLAAGIGDAAVRAVLIALAAEYEAQIGCLNPRVRMEVTDASYVSTREDNEMTEAEATVRHAIANAMMTSGDTGLRAGPGCDRLMDAIIASLLDPPVSRAVRDLTLEMPGDIPHVVATLT